MCKGIAQQKDIGLKGKVNLKVKECFGPSRGTYTCAFSDALDFLNYPSVDLDNDPASYSSVRSGPPFLPVGRMRLGPRNPAARQRTAAAAAMIV